MRRVHDRHLSAQQIGRIAAMHRPRRGLPDSAIGLPRDCPRREAIGVRFTGLAESHCYEGFEESRAGVEIRPGPRSVPARLLIARSGYRGRCHRKPAHPWRRAPCKLSATIQIALSAIVTAACDCFQRVEMLLNPGPTAPGEHCVSICEPR